MCGRYVISSKYERIRVAFEHPILNGPKFDANLFVLPGEYVPVISSANPNEIELMRFGFTPSWGSKKHFAINARAEGDRNKENTTNYKGGYGILQKPFFKTSIRQKRCLVIADAFIEGPHEEKLKKPYLVYPRNKQRPFTMAGVWDEWKNPDTGVLEHTFAIITYTSNDLMQRIGHHRSPVIIPNHYHRKWLNINTPLSDITKLFKPFDSKKWNAFRIDSEKMKTKSPEGLMACSPTIYNEYIDLERTYTKEEKEKGEHLKGIHKRRGGFKN